MTEIPHVMPIKDYERIKAQEEKKCQLYKQAISNAS
jgi:hypothetical protein